MTDNEKVELAEYPDGKKLILTTELPIGITTNQVSTTASILKTLYDSFKEAGFTPYQAMDLVKALIMSASKK